MELSSVAKCFIYFGIILIIIGGLLYIFSKIGVGRLPGDIFILKGSFKFYFPLATSIIISIILTLILNILSKK